MTAQTWEGLGFGFAHSVAYDGVCVIAKELATVNGELSAFFGADEANINSDAFHRALLNESKIDEYLAASSANSTAMDAGYARAITTLLKHVPRNCRLRVSAQIGLSP